MDFAAILFFSVFFVFNRSVFLFEAVVVIRSNKRRFHDNISNVVKAHSSGRDLALRADKANHGSDQIFHDKSSGYKSNTDESFQRNKSCKKFNRWR